jgi:hypothetical protein
VALLVEIKPTAMKALDELRQATGAETYEEVLDEAIALFRWAFRERHSGRLVASVDENAYAYKEVEVPLLKNHVGPSASHLPVAVGAGRR